MGQFAQQESQKAVPCDNSSSVEHPATLPAGNPGAIRPYHSMLLQNNPPTVPF